MKLKHVSEIDFSETEHDYPDFQFETAEKIKNFLNIDIPIIPSLDGKKLTLITNDNTLNITRGEREYGIGKYKITIEPII